MRVIIGVEVGIIGVFVMLKMRHFQYTIGRHQRNDRCMADQFIEPAQLVAGAGVNIVLGLMRRQIAVGDIEKGNRKGNPGRQCARQHQRPKRQPADKIGERPEDHKP